MAHTQVKLTSPPNARADDRKKHLMNIFRDVTKDCKHKQLRRMFDEFADYDALNSSANLMFSSMVDCDFLDEARELFKPLPDQVTLPEVIVFTMVIQMYTIARKTMDAHKVYQQMIASGVLPTAHTYTTIILATTLDPNFVGYAKKYFLEMLDRGMKPPYATYRSVMDAISYRGPGEEANKFVEQIKAKGFIPDHNGFQNKPCHLRITFMCDDLHHNNILDRDVQKFVKKLRACPTNLIESTMKMFCALADDGNVSEAIEFNTTITKTRTEPSVLFHTLVIEAYLKFGKIKGALEAYLAMLAAGIAPNSYTYTVLIKGLAAYPEFFGDAKKYLLEMMDKGNRPNAATFTAVIEGFANNEDKAAEEEGKEYVRVMMDKGFVPNAKAMREVLKGRPIPVIRRIMNVVLSNLKG
ncbi:PREDICTED: pentatricopeptide repeat-containing protein At1g62930, chloroplastic-like [Fragaria vesca subsp. vesca]|uniref:pentatricopeptide repeat-containing protein At1g62930, chloroplastic-like n=1 Tax=Fragaria vesca subsp. vesca TaxID=101020 RepID=UPI0002C300A7|nr:PREDICTED: pentatricopeptide repeat-containing protein At1g62930, chloroplastic-like [Fragaria vesca subsp. vesca]